MEGTNKISKMRRGQIAQDTLTKGREHEYMQMLLDRSIRTLVLYFGLHVCLSVQLQLSKRRVHTIGVICLIGEGKS